MNTNILIKQFSNVFSLLITILLIIPTSNQYEFNQPTVSSITTSNPNGKYNVPFLIIMSSDEVSIAQLPLIDNGSVSVVYSLADSKASEVDEVGEKEEENESTSSRTTFAEAQSEQMPLELKQTSLGKHEWNENMANRNKNISTSTDTKSSSNQDNERQEVGAVAKEEADAVLAASSRDAQRKEVSRPRRSNSLSENNLDDGNNGSGNSIDKRKNQVAVPESATQNVTSARFRGKRWNKEEERNGGAENARRRRASIMSAKAIPKKVSAEDDKNSDVQFSDFDVHMALGYAFVADSTGRIHRFRLSGSELANLNGNSMLNLGPENDYANTIDLVAKSSSKRHDNDYLVSAQTAVEQQKFYSSNVTASDEVASPKDSLDGDGDANKVARTSNDVTHEQSGRHPAASGLEQPVMAHDRKLGSSSGSEAEYVASSAGFNQWYDKFNAARPRIIWSRTKSALLHPGQVTAAEQKFNSTAVEGASLKHNSITTVQVGNAYEHLENATESDLEKSDQDEQQLFDESGKQISAPAGSENSSEQTSAGSDCASLTSQLAAQKKKPGSHLRTEIAVDWLNNLLFVLDKYSLVVMDFDGNNELVLIDDFNKNNRPIDIKVDPVNDFLFWIQVGNFHNTIYKLDLSVLSMPKATERLIASTARISANKSDKSNFSNDQGSDLVALISHHYAHPIITNLPQHARLFSIDHKHSRIYVPLAPSRNCNTALACNKTQPEDIEVFKNADEPNVVTHLNNTSTLSQADTNPNYSVNRIDKNCSEDLSSSSVGQILAYNLDGTDMGPLRNGEEKSHMSSLDDMQDITLDSDKGLLYWLTNGGKELFEEYQTERDSSFYSAQHSLDGKKYSKLIHFGSNQPRHLKPRFNLKKLIHILSTSTATFRQERDDHNDQYDENRIASGLNGRRDMLKNLDSTRFARNAPFIILGATCLVVFTAYLVYSFIFQQRQMRVNNSSRDGSISGFSSNGSDIYCDPQICVTTNDFPRSGTISRPMTEPSGEILNRSTTNNELNHNEQQEAHNVDSMHFNSNIGVTENYNDLITNWSRWPNHVNDVPNKLYVPIEVLEDKTLSSIQRIEIDQLAIDHCKTLGRGFFGIVFQGSIACTKDEKTCLIHGKTSKNSTRASIIEPGVTSSYPITIDNIQSRRIPLQSSTSSGHGSSSTSSEFTIVNTVANGDYLAPRSYCNSYISDYAVNNQASTTPDSYSSYYNSSVCYSSNQQEEMKISCSNSNQDRMQVAVKKLKEDASDKEKRDFLQEAKLLASFNHPNIVQLIGICLDRGSTLIVMEYLPDGDLKKYMTKETFKQDDLTEDDLLSICLDIVNGCCYLEELKYIHRDLAARNCLISSGKKEERIVKLADFGLARDIYEDSFYKKVVKAYEPIKWMAPESIQEQIFTTKTDVWSFGVVMWEVMSYCSQNPYNNVEGFLMGNYLLEGKRLARPKNCCIELYKLMNACWALEPSSRPTFQECRAELIEIKSSRNQ